MSRVSQWINDHQSYLSTQSTAAVTKAAAAATTAATTSFRRHHHHLHFDQDSIKFVQLPYHLSLLPALFRTIAFLCVLPVLALTLGDVIGWAIFKLILRPLGYSSVVRYKDPDPPTNLTKPHRLKHQTLNKVRQQLVEEEQDDHNNQNHDDETKLRQRKKKRPSSLPAPLRRVRQSSPDLNAFELDQTLLLSTRSNKNSGGGGGDDDTTSTGSSSTASSPLMTSRSLSRSPSSSPRQSPRGLGNTIVLPLTSTKTSTSSSTTTLKTKKQHSKRQRSFSETSTTSSIGGLQRFRAPSIGWEGPLLGNGIGSTNDVDEDLTSPLRSDDELVFWKEKSQ
ncbi:hypothetical protein OIO90_003446 [Microbotryomycetes sp. JL221]|nr:hypothetical protein OIO90_003446 [Microbotryomycetes sp. JL221]